MTANALRWKIAVLLLAPFAGACAGSEALRAHYGERLYVNTFGQTTEAVVETLQALNMRIISTDESRSGETVFVAEFQTPGRHDGGRTAEARARHLTVHVTETDGGTVVRASEPRQTSYASAPQTRFLERFFLTFERRRGIARSDR